MVSIESIRAGSFDFPITGRFSIESAGDATFRNARTPASAPKSEQLDRLATQIQLSWERFAKGESGTIVRPFTRSQAGANLALLSMATEFASDGKVSYYVQFAVSDGPRFGSLFAEGEGKAIPVYEELLPIALRARVVDGG